MKTLYQCEVCGQTFGTATEAMHCEESGPRPEFKVEEEVRWWKGFGDRNSNYELVVIKKITFDSSQFKYQVEKDGEEFGIWPEKTLSRKK